MRTTKDESKDIVGEIHLPSKRLCTDLEEPLKQELKKSLDAIVFMDNTESSIFQSELRGLVYHAADKEESDPVNYECDRMKASEEAFKTKVGSLFVDSRPVLNTMEAKGMLRILRNIAVDDDALYNKMVVHARHRPS